jgi:hypothetical protein
MPNLAGVTIVSIDIIGELQARAGVAVLGSLAQTIASPAACYA